MKVRCKMANPTDREYAGGKMDVCMRASSRLAECMGEATFMHQMVVHMRVLLLLINPMDGEC